MALLKHINLAIPKKLVGLAVLFWIGATSRQTYVVMCKRRFVSVFCAIMSTKSGVGSNFLFPPW
jgi:hypothetical protein